MHTDPTVKIRKLLASFVTLTCALAVSLRAQQTPNIVIILADDMGYGDVSFNGCPDYQTPNIDSIAANGALCTNGYVTHPFCSPSRAALLTGRYQQRFGHEYQPTVDSANPRLGLPMSELLLPQLLKPAGYVCGIVGKWHLGYAQNFHPLNRGFDEFFGFIGASSSYYSADVFRGHTALTETSYLTDAFTREGVSFINRHAAQPFFLYLAYNAVHAPYDTPPDTYMNRVSNITDPARQKYAAMVVALDDGIGQVLQALQTNNVLSNTLIFFLSDNGAPRHGFTRNNPLRGYKWDLLEGGVRIPFAVQWSGHVPAQVVFDQPVSSLDIVATAAAATGVSLPADRVYDGLNILPYLSGQQSMPSRNLFWRVFGLGNDGPQGWASNDTGAIPTGSLETIFAVRSGSLKLVREWTMGQAPGLYNLLADIGEAGNLASSQPDDVSSLTRLYNEWSAETIPPLWQNNTDFQTFPLSLVGDWNGFNVSDSTQPWQLTRITAPAVQGSPDAFNWFTSTIHVAAVGGDTTGGIHSFAVVGRKSYSNQWGGVNVNVDAATTIPFSSGGSLGPINSISFDDNFYYSFRILDPMRAVPTNLKVGVMKTSAPPVSLSCSAQTPQAPTAGDSVVVTITTSQPKSAEERIYLRWSTDFFITSQMVPAAGAGVDYSATIPPQAAGTAVEYSALTSTADLSPLVYSGAIDYLTLATTPLSKFVVSGGNPDPSPSPSASPSPSPNPSPSPSPSASPSPSPSSSPSPSPSATPTTTDLKVTITDGKSAAIAGNKDTYTIVVTNAGPNIVTGATVSDTLPSSFATVTYTATQSGGATGFTSSGTGSINDTVNMPVASKITYKATGKLNSSASGTLSNTATITPPAGVTDSRLANNSATDTDSITFQADLKVTVTDGKTSAVAGSTNTYTITVTNVGPSNVTGATIQDNFPSTFTGVTYTATQIGGASGFSASGSGNINDTVNLPPTAKVTYKAKGTISPSAAGNISDAATVSVPSGVTDPNLANNSATDTDTL